MLHPMKSRVMKYTIMAATLSAFMGAVNASASTLSLPLSPGGQELTSVVTSVKDSQDFKDTRNNVRAETIITQSKARPLSIEVGVAMASAMKRLIMPEQQAAMENPDDPNSLSSSMAPEFLK